MSVMLARVVLARTARAAGAHGHRPRLPATTVCFRALSSNAQHDKALASYDKDGYAILGGVVDSGLIQEAQDHVAWVMKRFPSVPPEHLHHPILRNDAFWVRLVSDPRLLDVAERFVGPNIALFSSHYFCKLPRTGMSVLFHQDGAYWPLDPMEVVTLWLAVDRADEANGCLRVVRGSHTHSLAALKPDKSISNVLGSRTDIPIDPAEVRSLELDPGDVEIHHPNLIHGSNANRSDRRRCGLTIRYMPATTRCLEPSQPVMMMRGEAVPGVNSYRSWPKYRPGQDFAFRGCEEWNARRWVNPDDEAFFERTDQDAVRQEITQEVHAIVRGLAA